MTGHRTLQPSTTRSTPTTCAAPRHGDRNAYAKYKCRCPEARAASTLYQKKLNWAKRTGNPPLVDATGTRRRLQGLARLGWSSTDLAQHLGVTSCVVRSLLSRRLVRRSTAQRVHALYDQLWNTPGPSTLALRHATTSGWPPPLFWDDDLIDDPTYPGEQEYADQLAQAADDRRRELDEQVSHLTADGWSSARIAERLGVTARTVVRVRARQRQNTSALSEQPDTVEPMQQTSAA